MYCSVPQEFSRKSYQIDKFSSKILEEQRVKVKSVGSVSSCNTCNEVINMECSWVISPFKTELCLLSIDGVVFANADGVLHMTIACGICCPQFLHLPNFCRWKDALDIQTTIAYHKMLFCRMAYLLSVFVDPAKCNCLDPALVCRYQEFVGTCFCYFHIRQGTVFNPN